MGDKDLTSKELKKIAQFLDKKVKPVVIKHGKKIGGAALTAVIKTATTFGPTKKVKVAYKAGKAVVAGVKKIKNTYTNPKPVVKTKKEIGKGWDLISKKTMAKMDSQIKQMGAKKIEWKAPPFKFKVSRKQMITKFKKNLGLKKTK